MIELVIVVAIIAIATTIALTTFNAGLPQSRLNETTRYVQTAMLRARAAAVRTGRYQKVCIFRDANVGDLVPNGKILRFECAGLANTAGDCPAGTICQNVDAASGTLYDTTKADCLAGEWCLTNNAAAPSYSFFTPEDSLNLDPTTNRYFQKFHTSIMGFAVYPNQTIVGVTNTPPSTQASIEVTYGPTGTVNTGRTTTNFTQGTIFTSNYDFCAPNLPPGCTGQGKTSSISYVLGGPVKTRAK